MIRPPKPTRWRQLPRFRGILAAAVVAAIGPTTPPSALAVDAGPDGERQARPPLLGDHVTPAAGGLFEVRVAEGRSLLTHGPDPLRADEASTNTGLRPGEPERPPLCTPESHQHVLYGHVAGSPNRLAFHADEIRATIRRMNALLNSAALASGGVTADYRVLCDGRGTIEIDSFVSPTATFEDVVRSAQLAGFSSRTANYTIFFDASVSECGFGSFVKDEELSSSNQANAGGAYAVTYKSCWFSETPMHEVGHTQGAVQYGAPHSTGSNGHCNDERDVMCYVPDGGDRNQIETIVCADALQFDCGYDDYFDASPEAGEYLSGHWNLGSRLNRFIAFGDQGYPGASSSPGTGCFQKACARRLFAGAARRDTAAEEGGWELYRLRVPRDRASLEVSLKGPECCGTELDLYVSRGSAPTQADWPCRSRRVNSSYETCRLGRPRAGTWFVGVNTARGIGGAAYTIGAALEARRGKRR